MIVKHDPIFSRLYINGKRYAFLKWPEAEWLAVVDAETRELDDGRSAFDRPEQWHCGETM